MNPSLPQLEDSRQLTRERGSRIGLCVILTGSVQGNGFRPRLARLAAQQKWSGTCRNTDRGIEIVVVGDGLTEKELLDQLRTAFPEGFELLDSSPLLLPAETASEAFRILESEGSAPCRVKVPLDVAICPECLADVSDSSNRRHNYFLTTCATCGPRYSLLTEIPFDRVRTTLAPFTLCPDCHAEYTDPDDRRFHAQTIACPRCGPRFWCEDQQGCRIENDDLLLPALQVLNGVGLNGGGIVALRGVGGYQLLCDATSQEAVLRLRELKQRPEKPLALLCDSVEMAETISLPNDLERETLRSPANPIVLVQRRRPSLLAEAITGELSTVGIMLPTTAIHRELSHRFGKPLVATSGNLEGEPLAVTPEEARKRLAGIADLFLHHNREISHPIDDSVVRIMAHRVVTIRGGRGMAPQQVDLGSARPMIALGGHQKNAIAISNGVQSVLAPHVGDLDSLAARESWLKRLSSLKALYKVNEPILVTDQHPDYYPTLWSNSQQRATSERLEPIGVWHHHAHVVTGMIEQDWLDREVLGIAFDGTGLGPDGTIWGGEFLRATVGEFTRVGSIRPFSLIGGEQATRELARSAIGLLTQLEEVPWDFVAERLRISPDRCRMFRQLIERTDVPRTSSCGRLFDGVAALILGLNGVQSEGIGPMRLESICDETSRDEYPFEIRTGSILELDWRPALRELLEDLQRGEIPARMAAKFHRGLANAVVELANRFELPVVLGGGVFQNRFFVEAIAEYWPLSGPPLGLPGKLPPNDGGLAIGQLAIAAARLKRIGLKQISS